MAFLSLAMMFCSSLSSCLSAWMRSVLTQSHMSTGLLLALRSASNTGTDSALLKFLPNNVASV